jgi:excisionase family DNA binding protein
MDNNRETAIHIDVESSVRLLDYQSSADYLGLSYWTLRNMTQRGDLPFIRAGRRVLIDRKDLDRWIVNNKTKEEVH